MKLRPLVARPTRGDSSVRSLSRQEPPTLISSSTAPPSSHGSGGSFTGDATTARLTRRFRIAVREAPLVLVVAAFGCVLLTFLPAEMSPDGWYALLGGDVIVHHGLPSHNSLTIWGGGREWVDQQWLAQLVYYALYTAGGLRLALVLNATIVVATLAGAVALARLRGGGLANTAWVAGTGALALGWSSSALRPQTLALPLFVAVAWLLIADARCRSRRVFAVVPLLMVWANLHGSVTVGVGLVILQAVAVAWTERSVRLERGLLAVLSLATPFASPYTWHLGGYYRTILFNREFATYLPDWMPTSLGLETLGFYTLAFASVFLLASTPKQLTSFERTALVALLALGVDASRGVTWFSLFALLTVPAGLRPVRLPSPGRYERRIGTIAVLASAAAVAVTAAISVRRGESWFAGRYPTSAAREAAAAAGQSAQVFANGAFADWLLLLEPSLHGRVAYDARFELLRHGQLAEAAAVTIGRWDTTEILRPFDVAVLLPQENELRDKLTRDGWRRVSADPAVVILKRSRTKSSQTNAKRIASSTSVAGSSARIL